MTEFVRFTFENIWHFLGVLILAYPVAIIFTSILNVISSIITLTWSRFMRMLMVRKHGWPTNPNLDADGDFKSEEKDTNKNTNKN
jgi:hypothetical protein